MSEWQPIETAPRDGTTVLAWFSGTRAEAWPELAHWMWPRGPWVDPNGGYIGTATHWMPLPEPPEAGQ